MRKFLVFLMAVGCGGFHARASALVNCADLFRSEESGRVDARGSQMPQPSVPALEDGIDTIRTGLAYAKPVVRHSILAIQRNPPAVQKEQIVRLITEHLQQGVSIVGHPSTRLKFEALTVDISGPVKTGEWMISLIDIADAGARGAPKIVLGGHNVTDFSVNVTAANGRIELHVSSTYHELFSPTGPERQHLTITFNDIVENSREPFLAMPASIAIASSPIQAGAVTRAVRRMRPEFGFLKAGGDLAQDRMAQVTHQSFFWPAPYVRGVTVEDMLEVSEMFYRNPADIPASIVANAKRFSEAFDLERLFKDVDAQKIADIIYITDLFEFYNVAGHAGGTFDSRLLGLLQQIGAGAYPELNRATRHSLAESYLKVGDTLKMPGHEARLRTVETFLGPVEVEKYYASLRDRVRGPNTAWMVEYLDLLAQRRVPR